MLFNSLLFAVFFPSVVFLYYALAHRHRWKFLLAASYYFYMCWRVEYILLIIASTLVDYYAALGIEKARSQAQRRRFLALSLAVNLGLLFAFKYFNFAAGSLQTLFNHFNILIDIPAFKVLLPVGISFYTFQTLSYTIEVYRGTIKPEKHLGLFALYVSFFPQLVAGPIERPDRLLPQFRRKRDFSYDRAREGLIRMLWGFFKKLVIADRLAVIVNETYGSADNSTPESLLVATYFFAFQIYCDFSGYSDIAIGGARVLGFDLMENFRQPYYSKSIGEFWQRWHISLSTWFRDYVYIPLGGNRVHRRRMFLNLLIVFTVSGLWHGAHWTFVAWGAYHGILLILGTFLTFEFLGDSRWARALKVFVTFHLVCIGWIFFRAENISSAFSIVGKILSLPLSYSGEAFSTVLSDPRIPIALLAIAALEAVHGLERKMELGAFISARPKAVRWVFYTAVFWGIFLFGEFGATEFIYFQF